MKKRVVALLLSLSLCMASVIEAGAAALEDPASGEAEVTALFDDAASGEESVPEEVQPLETAPETDEQEPEDVISEVPEEVEQDPVIVEEEPEEETFVPDITEEELPAEDLFTSDPEQITDEVPEDADAVSVFEEEQEELEAAAAVDDFTVTASNWEQIGGKWRLHKNSARYAAQMASAAAAQEQTPDEDGEAAAEADDTEIFGAGDTVSEDTKAPAEEAVPEGETAFSEEAFTEEPVDDTVVFQEEDVPEAASVQEDGEALEEAASVQEGGETLAEAGASGWFTDQDGLVEIKILDSENKLISTGKYLFDKDGYMITGQKSIQPGTPGYDLTAAAEYFFMDSSHAKLNTGVAAGSTITPYNSDLGQAQKSYWLWTGSAFCWYDAAYKFVNVNTLKAEQLKAKKFKGYFTINGSDYCLDANGKPKVGIVKITEGTAQGEYYFMDASRSGNGIPGKMLRNGWMKRIVSGKAQWRFYKTDGRYYNTGIIATKLDKKLDPSVGDYKYLLSKDGYLYKSTVKKAADGYYYIADKNGRVQQEKLVKYGKYRYYFDANGRRVSWKKGWYRCKGAGNRYYYFGKTPGRVTEKKGWQKIVTKGKMRGWFYFPKSGNHYINKLTKSGYYFRPDGRLAGGITEVNGKVYFFRTSTSKTHKGKMYKKTWIKYKKKWYYAGKDGALYRDGLRKIGKSYYYFQKNCATKTNCFIKNSRGVNGYLDSKGKVCTGWVVRNNAKNLVSYVDRKGSGFLKNTSKVIGGKTYFFDKKGYRINDVSNKVKGPYYVEVDRMNGVMTVYNKAKTIPVKSIRVSVGNPITLTPRGTYVMTRSARWQPLMGPSWGQYGTHVYAGVYVHSVACSAANSYNLPAGEYNKLGYPASHGCIRVCVADAKWVYDNCHKATIRVFQGKTIADDALKGPLGKPPLTPLRGSGNFDPTDPAV